MTKLEQLVDYLANEKSKAINMFSTLYNQEVDNYKKEYEGERNLRKGQVLRPLEKGDADNTQIPLNFQELIVKVATSFLFSNTPTISLSDEKTDEEVSKLWKHNRMGNLLSKFCTTLKSETESVIMFWLADRKGKKTIKAKLYTSDDGDYAPMFDEYGDLIAFNWRFKAMVNEKEVHRHWIYTADFTYKLIQDGSGWIDEENPVPQQLGMIPVVFMEQKFPEWWKVRKLIDRYETGFSKFCDTNDYFGSPMVVIRGEVKSLPNKDKVGKLIEFENTGDGHGGSGGGKDIEYLTWQHAPASTKLEWDTSKELIYNHTRTPDLSFNNLKGMSPSGVAMKMQFMGAELKAGEEHGDFQRMIERCVVVFSAMLKTYFSTLGTSEDFETAVTFNSPLPEAIESLIATLSQATGGEPVMSQKTAIELNPLVEDVTQESERITEERERYGETTDLI